jgi:arylsulfatase A-like enzyme
MGRAAAILGVLAGISCGTPGGRVRVGVPLNVVFILADDLGWGELGCYGQTRIRTPNLDRLASQGMRFTRHYSGAPVCAPSRNALMTGLHIGHATVRGNRKAEGFPEGQHPIPDGALTIAEVFKKAGYATGAFGKWGLGPVGSTGDPNRQGFDAFFGYNCQSVAHSFYPPHLWRNGEKVALNAKPVPGHAKQPEGELRVQDWTGERHASAAILEESLKFLDRNAQRPFFLYLPFTEPHAALQPPPELLDLYPKDWDEKPYRGENGYTPHPRPRAAYAAMISNLDRSVGKVLEALDRLGAAERTLVVFTSDNGTTHRGKGAGGVAGVDADFFRSTAGLRAFKGSVYEGGIRVPLLVRWPGRIRPGSTSDVPSYFPDHFPTLCEAAGLPVPPGLDGVSLLPVLEERELPKRPPMLWAFPEYGGQYAVTFGNLKVVRQGVKTKQPGPWEVYDLVADPGEANDLAAKHPDAVRRAIGLLKEQVLPNAVFPMPAPDGP